MKITKEIIIAFIIGWVIIFLGMIRPVYITNIIGFLFIMPLVLTITIIIVNALPMSDSQNISEDKE